MKIQYEFTVEDLADVTRRAAARHQSFVMWRWRSRLIQSAVFSALLYWVSEGSEINRAVGATLCFLAIYAVVWVIRTRPQSAFYLPYLRKQLGSEGPFLFEVEITGDALITRQFGEEIKREWSSIAGVREAQEGLEIDLRGGSLVFVRDNGFASAEERADFLRQTRDWVSRGKLF